MDLAKRVYEAFRPYNRKAMILGGVVLLAHVAYRVVMTLRRTNKFALEVKLINVGQYLRGTKEPWALIYFNEGDIDQLEQLCQLLIFSGVNICIVSSRKNQKLMDKIQANSVQTHIRMRYDFSLFDHPDEVPKWDSFKDELDKIDCRLFLILGDTYKLGWRPFEEADKKREETEACIQPIYVLPMLMLAFAKTVKGGRKGMIHIDGKVEEETDETNNMLLDGAGAELLLQGIEYKRVVNLQTYLNL